MKSLKVKIEQICMKLGVHSLLNYIFNLFTIYSRPMQFGENLSTQVTLSCTSHVIQLENKRQYDSTMGRYD